jgi:hypothetical protein
MTPKKEFYLKFFLYVLSVLPGLVFGVATLFVTGHFTSVPVFIAVNGVAVCLAGGVLCLWVWKGGNEYMRRMNILCSCKENSTPYPQESVFSERRYISNGYGDILCCTLYHGKKVIMGVCIAFGLLLYVLIGQVVAQWHIRECVFLISPLVVYLSVSIAQYYGTTLFILSQVYKKRYVHL